jgi:hypothetical protein
VRPTCWNRSVPSARPDHCACYSGIDSDYFAHDDEEVVASVVGTMTKRRDSDRHHHLRRSHSRTTRTMYGPISPSDRLASSVVSSSSSLSFVPDWCADHDPSWGRCDRDDTRQCGTAVVDGDDTATHVVEPAATRVVDAAASIAWECLRIGKTMDSWQMLLCDSAPDDRVYRSVHLVALESIALPRQYWYCKDVCSRE